MQKLEKQLADVLDGKVSPNEDDYLEIFHSFSSAFTDNQISSYKTYVSELIKIFE